MITGVSVLWQRENLKRDKTAAKQIFISSLAKRKPVDNKISTEEMKDVEKRCNYQTNVFYAHPK